MIRRVLFVFVALVAFASSGDAQRMANKQSITLDNATAQAFTIPDPTVNSLLVTIETNDIRWWDDGTAPTAAVGNIGKVGTTITICCSGNARADQVNVVNFKAISTVAGGSTIRGNFGQP